MIDVKNTMEITSKSKKLKIDFVLLNTRVYFYC